MKRELSRREIYLLMALPGILILIVYLFGFELSRSSTVNHLSRTLDQERETRGATLARLAAIRQQIATLNVQLDQEKHQAAIEVHPALMVPARWTNREGRLAALRNASAIFENNGLSIIASQADPDARNVLSNELSDFATLVKSDGNHPVPEIWRIQVLGTYHDLLAAISRIDQQNDFVVPLAISMKIGDTNLRLWSVWVWV